MSQIDTKQIVEGYQILFRHIVDGLKEEQGGMMTMKSAKPYLLSFEEDMCQVPTSIFPSNDVRNQYIDAAFSLFNSGRYQEARSAFSFLQVVTGNDPNVLFGYGCCLMMDGQHEEAQEHFSKAEELMPTYVQASVLKIRSYIENGMKGAAQAALNSALDDADRQSDVDRRRLLVLIGQHYRLQIVR